MAQETDTERCLFSDLLTALSTSLGNDFRDNWDEARFGPAPAEPATISLSPRVLLRRFLLRRGYRHISWFAAELQRVARKLAPFLGGLQEVYDMFGDEESRQTLVSLLAFRCLGHRRIRLPLSTPSYWELRRRAERLPVDHATEMVTPEGWSLYRTDVSAVGSPLSLYLPPGGALNEFMLQQYSVHVGPAVIQAEPGDLVLDGGGCWGETALHFASLVGPGGCVFSFEFVPANLKVFRANLELNPEVEKSVKIVEKALWDTSGQYLPYAEKGPGTRVSADLTAEASCVETTTIDDFVTEARVDRVDFLKMDIEGAELRALRGAERTLRAYHPKLAICVYHKAQDLNEIPLYINSLGLGYAFALRHFTIHAEETVLFAWPSGR